MNNKKSAFVLIIITALLGLLLLAQKNPQVSSMQGYSNTYKYKISNELEDSFDEKYISEAALKEKYLILQNGNEEHSISLSKNICKVLEYMKKAYEIQDAKDFKAVGHYKSIIITFENIELLSYPQALVEHVRSGGSAFFAFRPLNFQSSNAISGLIGVVESKGVANTKGIIIKKSVMARSKGYASKESFFANSSLNARISENCDIYAETSEGIPLLWVNKYGKGRAVVFNGTNLWTKMNRGLLAGALSLTDELFVYPVLNSKIVFIDDFPAPFTSGKNEEISKEYGMDNETFFYNIWWRDVLKAAEENNVLYTGVIIETYNNKVNPPFFPDDPAARKNLVRYGEALLKTGGELGIHGYNHQSLAPKGFIKADLGYNPWPDINNMREALKEVHRFFKEIYPNYELRVYVPPSNILSPQGRAALREAIPSIKIISSLYMNDYDPDAYLQEFEAAGDGILEYPRISYAYSDSDETMWYILNGIGLHGLFSHFIHPDDLFDMKRSSGLSWKQLSVQYGNILKRINADFGWLRPMTASDGGEVLRSYLKLKTYFTEKNGTLYGYCNGFAGEAYFMLKSEKKPLSSKNCIVTNIDENLYLVFAKYPSFSIELSSGGEQ
ncbi:MAG: DUF2194 domain-containing protein [Clostridia bacterium]|nr:DUF2194 domain-containing protein [Clostridia bacterium]